MKSFMKIDELQELPSKERKALLARRAQERAARQEKMGEQRRALLLDVATDLLAESGWEGFNLRDMAARAGYSAGALYAYFESKEHLLSSLRARWLSNLRTAVEQAKPLRGRSAAKPEGPVWQQLYMSRMQLWWGTVARHPIGSTVLLLPWEPARAAQPAAGLLHAMEQVTAPAQDVLEEGWGDSAAARCAHGDILALGMGYVLALGSAAEPALVQAMESRFLQAMRLRLQSEQAIATTTAEAEAQPDLFTSGAA